MDPVTAGLILEGAKAALQIFMTNAKLAGKSEEEIEQIFKAERQKFLENDPTLLSDV